MRDECDMYEHILYVADSDPRIHAIYINGSRANDNAPKDMLQDYDIVYVVDETEPFIEDKNWINTFGEILIMQYPDENMDYPSDKHNFYGWLMIFTDGNRIDLHVETIEHARKTVKDDSLCVILLDKDNTLPVLEEPSEKSYYVRKPNYEQFRCACNEFWWCLNNVAKGLWRKEITYAQDMVNNCLRPQLLKMLSWKIGICTEFSVSIGKSGKYMNKWLTDEEWQSYLATYFTCDVKTAWKSVSVMCDFFSVTSKYVGEKMQYEYNEIEEKNARKYYNCIKNL